MADNRIYLKCNSCGGLLFLGKRLGGGYFWANYGLMNKKLLEENPKPIFVHGGDYDERPLEDRLNEFYHRHYNCAECLEVMEENDWPDNFRIIYENDDDFVYKEG